jgi:protein gp37
MAEKTEIAWTDSTFNPWIGCSKVGPGCDHCYAEKSTPSRTMGVVWGARQRRHRTSESNWKKPLHWNAGHDKFFARHGHRRRVFCASLADVFDNEVPHTWREDLWKLIEATPNLDWIICTKRIGIVPPWMALYGWPANAWLLITVCNQEEVDRDVPKLLQLPVPVRGLSVEPMLGRVDLCETFGMWWNQTMGCFEGTSSVGFNRRGKGGGIDWVIVGGESGPLARPMRLEWARSLKDQCAAAGAKFFFKQAGGRDKAKGGNLLDGVEIKQWTEVA